MEEEKSKQKDFDSDILLDHWIKVIKRQLRIWINFNPLWWSKGGINPFCCLLWSCVEKWEAKNLQRMICPCSHSLNSYITQLLNSLNCTFSRCQIKILAQLLLSVVLISQHNIHKHFMTVKNQYTNITYYYRSAHTTGGALFSSVWFCIRTFSKGELKGKKSLKNNDLL